MRTDPHRPVGKLIGLMAIFVLIGVPMVAFLWELLNDLLALEVRPLQLAIAVPVLLLFAGLLVVLARRVRRWDAEGLG